MTARASHLFGLFLKLPPNYAVDGVFEALVHLHLCLQLGDALLIHCFELAVELLGLLRSSFGSSRIFLDLRDFVVFAAHGVEQIDDFPGQFIAMLGHDPQDGIAVLRLQGITILAHARSGRRFLLRLALPLVFPADRLAAAVAPATCLRAVPTSEVLINWCPANRTCRWNLLSGGLIHSLCSYLSPGTLILLVYQVQLTSSLLSCYCSHRLVCSTVCLRQI